MAEYKQIRSHDGTISGTILRVEDQAHIPDDLGNRDRQAFEEWLAEGNTPDPPDPIPPRTVISSAEFLGRFTDEEREAVQAAAATNTGIAMGMTMGLATGTVDLTTPTTRTWVNQLVDAGCVTYERSNEILEIM